MIVFLRQFLSGFAEFGAARTVLGEEAPRCVGILGQLARDARAALAQLLAPKRLGVPLLPARRRQRGIVRRPRRSATLSFEFEDTHVLRLHQRQQFVNTSVPRGDLRNEPVNPHKQRRHQIGAFSTRRIVLSLRHGERESARRSPLNTSHPSHNAAEG